MPKIVPKIKKGDIFILQNFDANGHEQQGKRPHVIVTQITGGTVTVAPCTTSVKIRKYTVELKPDKENHLERVSFVLIAQAFASDVSFLGTKIGSVTISDMMRIQLEYVKYVTD
jgi:mRNA-degrading endonuclease toxin of MazEF toxin-antitoxin module